MAKMLKGDSFENRIRIQGKLVTSSPLHIGTGEESDAIYSEAEKKALMDEIGKIPKVSTIIRDHRKKPLIPGSSLRGVMRHWLLHVLGGMSDSWAAMPSRDGLLELSQSDQITEIRDNFSWLELLFGTAFNAGKIEVWDAICLTDDMNPSDPLIHWDGKRLTYVDTSVAIDPETGTAIDKLLYKAEVVPPGVEFEVNITGQNISDQELGLLLLALQGFNSEIYPICVGARSARGYGHIHFNLSHVYLLDKDDVPSWIKASIQALGSGQAAEESGYFTLPELSPEQQGLLIAKAKDALLAEMEV